MAQHPLPEEAGGKSRMDNILLYTCFWSPIAPSLLPTPDLLVPVGEAQRNFCSPPQVTKLSGQESTLWLSIFLSNFSSHWMLEGQATPSCSRGSTCNKKSFKMKDFKEAIISTGLLLESSVGHVCPYCLKCLKC